jgi:hypothetical protein
MTASIGGSSARFAQREPSEHIGIDKKDRVRVSLTRIMLSRGRRCRVRPPALPRRRSEAVPLLPPTTFVPRATDRTDLMPLSIFSRNDATDGAGRYIGRAREMWRPAPAAIAIVVAESPSAAVVGRGGGGGGLLLLPDEGPPLAARFGCIGMCGTTTMSASPSSPSSSDVAQ